jgi:beta-lactamase regulating signal transducer with metallopeptidase domain
MMPAIREFLFAVSDSLAASIIAKATITTAAGLLAAWLTRANRAAVRHALLAAMFGVILLLPVGNVLMPPLHVGVLDGVGQADGFASGESVLRFGFGTRVAASEPHLSRFSLSNLLLAGWGAGVTLFLLPMAVGLWQIRLIRRSGLPWQWGQSLVEALALDGGIHRRVEILLHEALPGPMTCGVLRPAIILPRGAENWSLEDLNRAIIHELEHVRRGDALSRCAARAACALYWFHPLIWIAWRKLVLEAERSCDDAVLRRSEATAYADQLVGLARRLSVAQRSPLLAMANRADLAMRVGAVLDSRQKRGRAGAGAVVLVSTIAATLVLVMSPLKLAAATQGPAGMVYMGRWSFGAAPFVDGAGNVNLTIWSGGLADRPHSAGVSGRAGDVICPTACWSYPVQAAHLQGLDRSGLRDGARVHFQLVRAAGTLNFDGQVENKETGGVFVLAPGEKLAGEIRALGADHAAIDHLLTMDVYATAE